MSNQKHTAKDSRKPVTKGSKAQPDAKRDGRAKHEEGELSDDALKGVSGGWNGGVGDAGNHSS